MELVRAAFILIWTVLTLLLSGFVLWRKLKRERIDFEDKVIDRALLSLGAGIIAGRTAYILLHLSIFGFQLGKWLSLGTIPGISQVAGVAFGLTVFWLSLGKDWKDPVEVVDYTAIGLAFMLFFMSLGNTFLQVLTFFFLPLGRPSAILPVFDLRVLLWPAVLTVSYLSLYIFLSRVEKKYRTYLWYRAKRRSAQTGFVTAVFLIGFGIFGLPEAQGLNLLPQLVVILTGIVLLYVRSGRSFFGKN